MEDDLDTIIPDRSNRPYDMKKVIKKGVIKENIDLHPSDIVVVPESFF